MCVERTFNCRSDVNGPVQDTTSVVFRKGRWTVVTMTPKLFLFIAVLLPALALAWPGGAPEDACQDFVPQHGVDLKDLDSAEFFLNFRSAKGRGKILAKTRNGVLPVKV